MQPVASFNCHSRMACNMASAATGMNGGRTTDHFLHAQLLMQLHLSTYAANAQATDAAICGTKARSRLYIQYSNINCNSSLPSTSRPARLLHFAIRSCLLKLVSAISSLAWSSSPRLVIWPYPVDLCNCVVESCEGLSMGIAEVARLLWRV